MPSSAGTKKDAPDQQPAIGPGFAQGERSAGTQRCPSIVCRDSGAPRAGPRRGARLIHAVFSHDAAPPEIDTLSLHDALPISAAHVGEAKRELETLGRPLGAFFGEFLEPDLKIVRSEEHTSELQSQSNLVCRLLLEQKKTHPISSQRSVRDLHKASDPPAPSAARPSSAATAALRGQGPGGARASYTLSSLTTPRRPRSTLFPYTTLFRSRPPMSVRPNANSKRSGVHSAPSSESFSSQI